MKDIVSVTAQLERRLAQRREDAAELLELAGLKLAAGDAAGAVDAYRQCLARAPANAGVYNNLGAALIRAGQPAEAIVALDSALAMQPGYERALANLGKALVDVGRLREAVSRLEEALARNPDHVPALVNYGYALLASGLVEAAEEALERAIRLAPRSADAHTTLGLVRLASGRRALALESLRTAVALSPEHGDAHSNLAHALFVGGAWEAAWPHFEYRFQRSAQRTKFRPPEDRPRWDGASKDLELWILGEQGLGDQLQFVRYANLLIEQGFRCVLACDPRLVALFSANRLASRVVPIGTTPEHPESPWVALMSLPAWHGTRPDTVPASDGYLAADLRRTEHWRSRLPDAGLRVAVAWAGNPAMETGRYVGRSPPLAAFAPLASLADVRLISLQKGYGEEQIAQTPFGGKVLRLDGLDNGADAFLDTAAVLTCVDLLLTSDTSIAHLGGALGVPTWVALMHEPDWRWMREGATTPWYRSMRLFRQREPGNWAPVFTEIADQLARLPRR
jgi:tetratricopeptide (TPR) repeat protein